MERLDFSDIRNYPFRDGQLKTMLYHIIGGHQFDSQTQYKMLLAIKLMRRAIKEQNGFLYGTGLAAYIRTYRETKGL